jgi:hypothetical protein
MQHAMPAPPQHLRLVAVPPPLNRTGSELVVAGDWYLERLLGSKRATALDVIGAETARLLGEHGFTIATPEAPGAAVLQITLRRFDAEPPGLEYVVTDLDATLIDGGRTTWSVSRRGWMVPTRGAPSVAESWTMAARAVAADLVGAWRPEPRP